MASKAKVPPRGNDLICRTLLWRGPWQNIAVC